MQNNVTFANLIHGVPVVLRAARLVQHRRPKEPAIALLRVSGALIHPPDRRLLPKEGDPLLG